MKAPSDDIKDFLSYDPDTGVFKWVKRSGPRSVPGKVINNYTDLGYMKVVFRNVHYPAHRLAWWWVYGDMPPEEVDHINGDRADNRICNLRLATRRENTRNARVRRDNTSCLKGVSPERGKFRARITVNGKRIYLGAFSTKEEAYKVVCAARESLHGDFCNHGN